MDINLNTKPEEVPIVQLRPDKSKLIDKDPWWTNLTTIHFEINGVKHSIRPGFVTNLGSVPKLVRHIVDPSDESMLAFIIHDYLYSKSVTGISRKDADKALYKIALICEQDRLEAGLTWLGVRVGGWIPFKKFNSKYIAIKPELLQKVCEDNMFIPNVNNYPGIDKVK